LAGSYVTIIGDDSKFGTLVQYTVVPASIPPEDGGHVAGTRCPDGAYAFMPPP